MLLLSTKKRRNFIVKITVQYLYLSNLSKVFERAVCNILYSCLITNNLLNPENAGFKQGDNTINQRGQHYQSAFEYN